MGPENADPMSVSPFGGTHLAFEQWLQHIFLPNAHKAIEEGNGPEESSVGIAAIRNLDGNWEAEHLVELLCEFDSIYN
jgi:uncharacterized protein YqcC (DUF446 family)